MIKKINLSTRIKYFFKKPKLVLLFGENFNLIEKIIYLIKKDIKIIHSNNLTEKELIFLLHNSSKPILIFKNTNNFPAYKIKAILNNFPSAGTIAFKKGNKFEEKFKLVLSPTQIYSFALDKKSDLTLTDLQKNHGTNFKINYKGNSIPFWIKEKLDQNKALNILIAIIIGVILKNNLVKISQVIKEKY